MKVCNHNTYMYSFFLNQIFEPVMQQKFARVSAAVKGYLTRRLLKTQKVQEILKTIKVGQLFKLSSLNAFLP